jgi:CO/xanthine dehydrogenase FAD-binding subunit
MAAETLVPTSVEEATRLFGDGTDVTVVGGATILMPELVGRPRPARALLLHRAGLAGVESADGRTRIGAMTTVATLAEGDGLLARFAREIADREVRAAATLGGNLCAPHGHGGQRGDLGAALIALGARVRSVGSDGEQVAPVEDFLAGNRTRRLVIGVELDDPPEAWSAQTMRRRHAHSYAIANVAVCATGDGIRVGVSGATPTAVRARALERSRVPEDVLADVEPVDDAVATAAYRRRILPLLVRRALDELETT